MAHLPILILKTGETVPNLKATRGDFEDWFAGALGGPRERFTVVRPDTGDLLPRPTAFAGIVITGSPASVTEEAGWIGEAAGYVLGAARAGVPVLGVCFGHQLIADAFGGRVERSPEGREMGTVTVDLTEDGAADPLFAGLPRRLVVQQSHEDAVAAMPEGAVHLAGNAHTACQAFALGEHVRAVQFHPEFDGEITRGYVEARADRLAADAAARGLDPDARVAAVRAGVADSDHGRQVLRNWHRHFVEAGPKRS
jgi:GMP synthase (glutamine-hydrolysing)